MIQGVCLHGDRIHCRLALGLVLAGQDTMGASRISVLTSDSQDLDTYWNPEAGLPERDLQECFPYIQHNWYRNPRGPIYPKQSCAQHLVPYITKENKHEQNQIMLPCSL